MNATELYRVVQATTIELCSTMSAEETEAAVPTCPDWTPRDVLAHVVGICADFKADRREGSGGDAWTAAQVASRSNDSVEQLVQEWNDQYDYINELFADKPDLAWALVADLVTHEHDIRLALNQPGIQESEAITASGQRYVDRFLDRINESELASLAVELDGEQQGPADVDVVLRGTAFEILRACTGRRSRSQIEAMDWSGDPSEHIEMISSYGPPSTDDIHE